MTDNNEQPNTEATPEGVERYVEVTITLGFTAKQTSVLLDRDPNFMAADSFLDALGALQDLMFVIEAFVPDPSLLSDISGVFQIGANLFEGTDVEPMRAAVRFRESEEWTANSRPNLYVDDGSLFLQNPPPIGHGEKNLPK